ncbi:MAG: RHS repeat-associated core domain-containing protein, partial [Gaiellaceae bacterium]
LKTVTRGGNTAFAYFYDANGNIVQRTDPDPNAPNIGYTYDALDRLIEVDEGDAARYEYDVASNLTRTTLAPNNGYVEQRSYDRAGRLTEVRNDRAGVLLSRFVSTLDAVGNPVQVVRTGSLSETRTYSYDASDRLTSVCFQAGSCPGGTDPFIRWTYDKVGNRLTEQRPAGTTSYTYDARERLLSAGATTFAYDQNGNQTQKGSETFTYDLANRLKTHDAGNTATTYLYDGDGKRLQASTGNQAAKKTNYVWDVSFTEPQISVERNGNGARLRRYVYGHRRIRMLAPSGFYSYYLYDGLGSVSNLVSQIGDETQWTWSYEPFGAIRTEQKASGKQPDNFMKFTGEYLDPTALYHLRARQYDAGSGRFLTRDPAEQTVNESVVSAYAYVANRPTVMVDPSGETFRFAANGQLAALLATSVEPNVLCLPTWCSGGGGGGRAGARGGGATPPRTGVPGGGPLANNLARAGEPKPGPGWIAHHIVAHRHRLAARTRSILEAARIPINDARNGVWIRKRGGHPNAYYREVSARIERAWTNGGARTVERELARLKRQIKDGDLEP